MLPSRFETVGEFLAIRWPDGEETVISLEQLRRSCPCAECSGEVDVTGKLRQLGAPKPYFATSFQLRGWEAVGNYAVQPTWMDGHATGIFTYERLRELGRGGDESVPSRG